jgi:PAS domain S-box-containing protein
MYINAPGDIEVLARPSWWNARHTLFTVGGLGGVLLLSLAWAGSLRNQVRQRTGELQEKVQEQKRTAAALRDSEGFLRSLMENLPQNIVRKDLQGRVTFANEFFCRTLGKSLAEILGKTDLDLYPPELAAKYRQDDEEVLRTGRTLGTVEESRDAAGHKTYVHVVKIPIHDAENRSIGLQIIFWDVTERKETEARLEAANKGLHEVSRQAGMAEVATGVLHNVGNVLNSVNVSATLVTESVRKSKVANVGKTAELLREHEANLAVFLKDDPRGRKVVGYLGQLADLLVTEQSSNIRELEDLTRHVEHIKDIVSMQQHYAKFVGVSEVVKVTDLVEDALLLNAGALSRHDIQLTREFAPEPILITVEKHKVLQILINLIRNAKYACDESGRTAKRMTVGVTRDASRVRISVADNGVGIAEENLRRIFTYGFTTRKDGHGFGLHSGILAAKEMDGALLVRSDGLGQGSVFTLELPLPSKV